MLDTLAALRAFGVSSNESTLSVQPTVGRRGAMRASSCSSMLFKVPSRPFALRTPELFVQGLGADASGHAARVLKVANLSPKS